MEGIIGKGLLINANYTDAQCGRGQINGHTRKNEHLGSKSQRDSRGTWHCKCC